MYSDAELDAAVREGVLSAEAASAFRQFVARSHAGPGADEEHFRLVTGFNDIFVAIATVLLLVALGWIGGRAGRQEGGLLVAACSWGLAEYFTRKRRLALPSIVLLLSFVGGVVTGCTGLLFPSLTATREATELAAIGSCAAGVGAAWLHWWRFRVPITVAAGAVAAAGMVLALILTAVPAAREAVSALIFAGGLGMFAFAMWWDMHDRQRVTRRADVAFWLHLAAAPMIVHPIFMGLGLVGRASPPPGAAGMAMLVYLMLALVALVVDRRAVLVSALGYVLYALAAVLRDSGSANEGLPLAALLIGSCLLLLSALWARGRAVVVRLLPPELQARLPPI